MGPTGEVGPTGATGDFARTFMSIYNLANQTVLTEANVVFDSNKTIVGSCGHVPGSTDAYFWQAGYYHIFFNLTHIEPCQFALYLNNVLISGSITGSPTGASQNTTTIIIEILPSDLIESTELSPTGLGAQIQVRNHTSYPLGGVTLDGTPGAGTAINQANSIFTAFLLSPNLAV
jgi:hypothetical protein